MIIKNHFVASPDSIIADYNLIVTLWRQKALYGFKRYQTT